MRLARSFYSSPFEWNSKTNNLNRIQSLCEKRVFWIMSVFHFVYIALAVLVQSLLRNETIDTSMVSLAFTTLLLMSSVIKIMFLQKPSEIVLLTNSLISFENRFGKYFFIEQRFKNVIYLYKCFRAIKAGSESEENRSKKRFLSQSIFLYIHHIHFCDTVRRVNFIDGQAGNPSVHGMAIVEIRR
jgi:hypothetical protein